MCQMNIFERLSVLANVLQLANYEQNIQQTSNDDLMKELQRQNTEYLTEIKKMLSDIISILKEKEKQ